MLVTISVLPNSKTARKEAGQLISSFQALAFQERNDSSNSPIYQAFKLMMYSADVSTTLVAFLLCLRRETALFFRISIQLTISSSTRMQIVRLSLTLAVNSSIVVLDIRAESSLIYQSSSSLSLKLWFFLFRKLILGCKKRDSEQILIEIIYTLCSNITISKCTCVAATTFSTFSTWPGKGTRPYLKTGESSLATLNCQIALHTCQLPVALQVRFSP